MPFLYKFIINGDVTTFSLLSILLMQEQRKLKRDAVSTLSPALSDIFGLRLTFR